MGDAYFPAAIDPVDWIVVFRPTSENWWVRTFTLGRFKHVSACAYIVEQQRWLTYDIGLAGTKIMMIPDGPEANSILAHWMGGCTMVRFRKNHDVKCHVAVFGWCAPAIARLIGLRSGALRPDALYRQCLRNGGTIINGRCSEPDTAACAAA